MTASYVAPTIEEDADAFGIPAINSSSLSGELVVPTDWLRYTITKAPSTFDGLHFVGSEVSDRGLLANPSRVISKSPNLVIEPNSTKPENTPLPAALMGVSQRRAFTVALLDAGIPVAVNLGSDGWSRSLATIGVPTDWPLWATTYARTTTADRPSGLDGLIADYLHAADYCGCDLPHFFVLGGGTYAQALCEGEGWHYIPLH